MAKRDFLNNVLVEKLDCLRDTMTRCYNVCTLRLSKATVSESMVIGVLYALAYYIKLVIISLTRNPDFLADVLSKLIFKAAVDWFCASHCATVSGLYKCEYIL